MQIVGQPLHWWGPVISQAGRTDTRALSLTALWGLWGGLGVPSVLNVQFPRSGHFSGPPNNHHRKGIWGNTQTARGSHGFTQSTLLELLSGPLSLCASWVAVELHVHTPHCSAHAKINDLRGKAWCLPLSYTSAADDQQDMTNDVAQASIQEAPKSERR